MGYDYANCSEGDEHVRFTPVLLALSEQALSVFRFGEHRDYLRWESVLSSD